MSLPHLRDYITTESALALRATTTRDSMLHRKAAQAAEDGSHFPIRRF
jgi:hypothetical protein